MVYSNIPVPVNICKNVLNPPVEKMYFRVFPAHLVLFPEILEADQFSGGREEVMLLLPFRGKTHDMIPAETK